MNRSGINNVNNSRQNSPVSAPILALDLGRKRVGVAVSDKLSISITRIKPIRRSNWKHLLSDVSALVRRFDAQTLVIGFPLSLDGTEGSAALEARHTAEKFGKSLEIPVYLQDERLTSAAALTRLQDEGYKEKEILALLDSESAAIILRDFLQGGQNRAPVLHLKESN